MLYDLILKGGTLVDPAQKLHTVQDVAFADGKVAAVGADLSAAQARQTLDVAGNVVAPRSHRPARPCVLGSQPFWRRA